MKFAGGCEAIDVTTFTNAFTTTAQLPSAFEETPDGFLRVKARPLKEGVLSYARHELSELPPELDGIDPIVMLVGMDALSSGETLRSLEAARVTAPEHIWVTPDNAAEVSKGSAAGAASISGPYQEIDLVVTDEDTINRIKARELGELSGGYHAESVYAPGEWNGQPYHLKQTQIVYNHIAILHPGEGRGGSDIRIINHKPQGGSTMVKIKLANTGKYVNVDEEAASAIEAEQVAAEAKTGEEKVTSGKKIDELIAEVEKLNAEIAALQTAAEESKGELSVYKEKIDELVSDENAEAAAVAMAEESGDADQIIENMTDDEKKVEEIKNSIGRIANTGIYKMRGTALQTAVLNAVGFKTEGMSAGEVKGAFRTHLHLANSGKGQKVAKREVAGAGVFQNKNTPQDHLQVMNARKDKLWGAK